LTLNFVISSLIVGTFNPLNAELNPSCHLLASLETHHIFYVSGLRVKSAYNDSVRYIPRAFTIAPKILF